MSSNVFFNTEIPVEKNQHLIDHFQKRKAKYQNVEKMDWSEK